MKICTCLNCDGHYLDPNPGDDSIDYPEDTSIDGELVQLPDEGEFFWACPKCKTDFYLVDNISI